MTAVDYSASAARRPIGQTGFWAAVRARIDAYRTYQSLDKLTDQQLEDVGLTRGDIARVAYGR